MSTSNLYLVDTKLLADGPGKGDGTEDHSLIFEELHSELTALNEPNSNKPKCYEFISRAHDGDLCSFFVNSSIEYIMDSPERRSNFGLLAGNSSIHSLFGLSCNFSRLERQFYSCQECFERLARYCDKNSWKERPPEPVCQSCHGFSLEDLMEHGKYTEPIYEPPHDLIETYGTIPGSQLFQRPGKLSNKLLMEAFIFARDAFLDGKMNVSAVRSYLYVLAFNSHTIDKMIKGCGDYAANIHDPKDENNTIQKPSPPILLRFCNLQNAVETLMHLTTNCIKNNQSLTFEWIQQVGSLNKTGTISELQKYFTSVKNLRVKSFPAMTFKTSDFGGYVAENHRTYLQILPWANRFLEKATKEQITFKDLKNRKKADAGWTRNECFAFLYCIKFPTKSNMTLNELILLVNQNFKAKKVRDLHHVNGKTMREAILTLNKFVASVYDKDTTGIPALCRASSLARLYLSYTIQLNHHAMDMKQSWDSSYSLVGMLRLIELYHLAPFPSCFYEGDAMGEGIIKDIRPLVLPGLRNGWSKSLIKTYYENKALSYLMDLVLGSEEIAFLDDQKAKSRVSLGKLKLYKSYGEVDQLIQNANGVFSFGFFKRKNNQGKNVIGILCKWTEHRKVLKIIKVENQQSHQDERGFLYYKTKLVDNNLLVCTNEDNLQFGDFEFINSGIALPWANSATGIFSFILEDGKQLINANDCTFVPS